MSQSALEILFVKECVASSVTLKRNAKGIISFISPCAEVGEMIVLFDDGEITVDIEHITHCHFTPYEAGETYPASTAADCARDAAQYVYDILKGTRALWRYPGGAGGTYLIEDVDAEASDPPLDGEDVEKFLWAGPYRDKA